MSIRRAATIVGILLVVSAMNALSPRIEAQNRVKKEDPRLAGLPPDATRCDLSIPLHVELVPLNQPEVGGVARFRVETESFFDSDMIQSSWIEYELPDRVRRADGLETREVLGRAKANRAQLSVVVPDVQRHEIRARYVIRLTNGRTMAQTAVRQINLGNVPPDEMIGRIIDSEGNGVQIYRGITVRD